MIVPVLVDCGMSYSCIFFFFQAEDGIRDLVRSRGLGDVYKRQIMYAAMGFVLGALGALLYNLIAKWIGGIEVEVALSLIHI